MFGDIKKNWDKIDGLSNDLKGKTSNRNILKSGDYPLVKDALYTWFLQGHRKHTPDEVIKEKARFFYKKIMKKGYIYASTGWLEKFKKLFAD